MYLQTFQWVQAFKHFRFQFADLVIPKDPSDYERKQEMVNPALFMFVRFILFRPTLRRTRIPVVTGYNLALGLHNT